MMIIKIRNKRMMDRTNMARSLTMKKTMGQTLTWQMIKESQIQFQMDFYSSFLVLNIKKTLTMIMIRNHVQFVLKTTKKMSR